MAVRIANHLTIFFIIMFLLITGTVKAQQSSPATLTLEESIATALSNNLSVKSAMEKVKTAEQKVNEARASMMPSISGSGSYTYMGKLPQMQFDLSSLLKGITSPQGAPSASGTGGTSSSIPLGNKDTYNAGISAQQPLFTWGKIYNAYLLTKISYEAEKQGLESVKQQVIFDTTKAFYGILLTDQLVRVTQMAVDQVQAHTKTAQDLVDAGMATDFDLLRAKVQLANIKSQLIKMQNLLKLSKDGFKNTVGMKLDTDITLNGEFTYKPIELDLYKLLDLAEKNRPEIKQLELQEKVGEKAVSLAKAGNKPNLALAYNYGYTSYADTMDKVFKRDQWNNTWSVTLALSVPIFDGLATRSRVKQAKSAANQIQIGKEQLLNGIGLEVRAAYLSFVEAKDLLNVQGETVQQAEESLRIANLRYKNGLITNVELTDTELALTQAQTNYSNALNDYIIAIAKLEKATASKLN
jgi:outer membrane protein TolC